MLYWYNAYLSVVLLKLIYSRGPALCRPVWWRGDTQRGAQASPR